MVNPIQTTPGRSNGSENTKQHSAIRPGEAVIASASVINGIQPSAEQATIQPRACAQASQELRQHASNPAAHNSGGNPRVGKFPVSLHDLLSHPAHQNIISWDSTGRSFTLHNRTRFEGEILNKYFNTSKIASFRRQLNLYDFQRVENKQGDPVFFHKGFVRDQPVNLGDFSLKKKKGSAQLKRASQSDVRDQDKQSTKMLKKNPTASDVKITLVKGDMTVINHHYYGHAPQQHQVTSNTHSVAMTESIDFADPDFFTDPDYKELVDGLISESIDAALNNGDRG